METEKKEQAPQAPAQEKAPEGEKKAEEKIEMKPSGLDGLTAAQLKDLYAKSPQMFEDAGITKKPEEKKPEPRPEPAKSAAPLAVDGVEIKLPTDFEVNKEAVEAYLAHAKEIGLNAKQVQAEIDFQVGRARAAIAGQPKPKSAEEIRAEEDAANVAKLKQEFGTKYDENMDIARRAAAKYGDPELLEKLKTSDPVLVKHFLKIGKADAEDKTTRAPNRNGNESGDAEAEQKEHLKQRYPNSPSMFPDRSA